jgi:hypothetical protein
VAPGIADIGRQNCLPDRAADMVEGSERLTREVQGFAPAADEAFGSPDRLDVVRLVSFGDRRKGHNLPRLLAQHMADQIIFVQPLHDDDNGAVLFVVLPAVEGVIVPVVSGVPLGVGERLLGFQWIIDQMKSAPRPVSTPPFELASR